MHENEIAREIVDAAYRIHKNTGPGLLESAYQAIMVYELNKLGLKVEAEKPIPLCYDSLFFEIGYRADLVVEDKVIVELKSVAIITDVHRKQLLTYLKVADKRLGLLINFGAVLIKRGITRIVNGLVDDG